MIQLPYFWLCAHERRRIENRDGVKTAFFSDGIVSEKGSLTQNGRTLKTPDWVSLPVPWTENAHLIYSDEAGLGNFPLSGDGIWKVSEITPEGLRPRGTVSPENGTVSLSPSAGTAVLLRKES